MLSLTVRKLLSGWGAVASVFCLLGVAHATPEFPGIIQTYVPTPATPACSICHNGTPGIGTVTTPFGVAMRARGLLPYDDDSLRTALDKMRADGVDSGNRGYSDIEALEKGEDPNGGGVPLPPAVQYGCAAANPTSLAAVGLLWVAWRILKKVAA